MIRSASHDSVSRLVAERSMCFATASDKAFEKIDCMIAILCCQAKNRLYESSQRLIQPRRVRCPPALDSALRNLGIDTRDPNVSKALEISLTMMFSGSLPLPPPAILKEYD